MLIKHHQFSLESYHRMVELGILGRDDKVELIEGGIITMTPIGSYHAATVTKLTKVCSRLFESYIVSVQNPLSLQPDSEPEPDLMILQPRPDYYAQAHPLAKDVCLLIEVADSSLEYDQTIKVPLYARAGIPEVWVLDINEKSLWAYSQAKGDTYMQSEVKQVTEAIQVLEFDIPVSELFV